LNEVEEEDRDLDRRQQELQMKMHWGLAYLAFVE
jgi:hypothetical protein